MAGLDYEYNETYGCYRQLLNQVVKRGRSLGYEEVNMGYTSVIEKKRFGAQVVSCCAYMQIKDNYTMEALEAMTTRKNREDGVNKRRVLPV